MRWRSGASSKRSFRSMGEARRRRATGIYPALGQKEIVYLGFPLSARLDTVYQEVRVEGRQPPKPKFLELLVELGLNAFLRQAEVKGVGERLVLLPRELPAAG